MTLSILQSLHDSEINWSLSAFYDGNYVARLGDEWNGFVAQETCHSIDEAIAWLDRTARDKYPGSVHAKRI